MIFTICSCRRTLWRAIRRIRIPKPTSASTAASVTCTCTLLSGYTIVAFLKLLMMVRAFGRVTSLSCRSIFARNLNRRSDCACNRLCGLWSRYPPRLLVNLPKSWAGWIRLSQRSSGSAEYASSDTSNSAGRTFRRNQGPSHYRRRGVLLRVAKESCVEAQKFVTCIDRNLRAFQHLYER